MVWGLTYCGASCGCMVSALGVLTLLGAGRAEDPCRNGAFEELFEALQSHYVECRQAGLNATCLPTRVSHPLVGLASNIVEVEAEAAQAGGNSLVDSPCLSGLVAALAVYAQPLGHTVRGQWAARMAFTLAGRGCWPTVGFKSGDWPVSYHEILEVALNAEAWHEHGAAAEYERPPRHVMPPPFIHVLTATTDQSSHFGSKNLSPNADVTSNSMQPRRVHILSTGHHASYPAAVFSMWRALLKEYDFELEDHSFDTRYCELAGSCSVDERFAWLGDHLRSTVVETCGGLYLKGFENIDAMAEELFALIGGAKGLASQADVLLCTHPPYSCRLFWPFVLRLDKPLLGFFGGTLEAHVPREGMKTWLHDFRDMAQHPRIQFAAISPFLAEKMRYQSHTDIPAARGFGFHLLAQGATYLPTRMNQVLLWKNSHECMDNQMDFDKLLVSLANGAAQEPDGVFLQFRHLRDLRVSGEASYSSILSFRAVVFTPYEILLMTFYELYHVAIPLFVPRIELGAFFAYRGPVTYPHCDMVLQREIVEGHDGSRTSAPYSPFVRDRATDRLAWLEAYSDWYRFPHLQRFSSLVELLTGLIRLDVQAVSAAMRQETEGALVEAAAFWRSAFVKVLDGPETRD